MKKLSPEATAQRIVLLWGNGINWGRYADKYGTHITEEDRFRLQNAIARAIRKAGKLRG
jgi:hypothetical protein